ncbi:MAG: DUF6576 domain-containing protein [Planctomycetota bacterium]
MSDGWRTGGGGAGDGGYGRRGFLSRVFGEGDNPMRWAVPLYRAWGISVKLHVIFILFVVIMAISSFRGDLIGPLYTLIYLGSLFGLVLMHEYGHCFACRHVGGEADEIMLWPLGGLAYCRPPHNWRDELITVVGGPAVNAALYPLLAGGVWLATGDWRNAFFNPFAPVWPGDGLVPTLLFSMHFMNLVLLLFNVLVPMYPMDSGRIVQCLLWRKVGYEKSLWIVCNVGMVAAVVVAVVAFAFGAMLLLGIALFGGITSWQQKQSLKMMGYEPQYATAHEPEVRRGPTRAQLAAIQKRQKEEAEVERLLAKIARDGMGSLSGRERRFLDRVSQKKRDSEAG